MNEIKVMKPFIGGQFIESKSEKFNTIYDPSTGHEIAKVPCCTREEVEAAIAAAKAAYPAWRDTPVRKRASIMMKQRSGKIINIASIVGLQGNAGQANYAASKAGIIGFTKSLAKELGSRGINVNAVAPGFVETDMTDVLSDKVKEAFLNMVPLKRTAKPEDIANAIGFLASEKADYITGQVLTVDGGMCM